DGTGGFADVTASDLPYSGLRFRGSLANSLALSDLDGDGDLDALTRMSLPGQGSQVRLLENDGSGAFTDASKRTLPSELLTNQSSGSLVVLDANGDGFDDFIQHSPPRLFLNDGSGKFDETPTSSLPASQLGDNFVPIGDVDLDGDEDLLQRIASGAVVLRNNGNGVFTPGPGSPDLALGPLLHLVEAIDIDGDRAPDLIFSNLFSRTWVLKNDGTGFFTDESSLRCPDPDFGPHGLKAGDFDGDGDQDLLLATQVASGTRLYFNDGSGVFQDVTAAQLPVAAADPVASIVVGDIDDDGDLDALLSGSRALINDGQGRFASSAPLGVDVVARPLLGAAFGDLDRDGDLDLFAGVGHMMTLRNMTRQVTWRSLPRLGQPLTLDVYGTPGASYTLLARNVSPAASPWRAIQGGMLDADGRATYARRIPADPVLVGMRLRAVALVDGRLTNLEPVTVSGL
ncbi:MAG: VCBS repeat-containing protein, partial [Planctomycetota bacterium]